MAQITTVTGPDGAPLATRTSILPGTRSVLTLRDDHGSATATVTIAPPQLHPDVPSRGNNKTAVIVTLTDKNGLPTQAITVPTMPSSTAPSDYGSSGFYVLTSPGYWAAFFLPVFFAAIASILAEMLVSSLNALLPFHRMASNPRGAIRRAQSLSCLPDLPSASSQPVCRCSERRETPYHS